MIQIQGFSSTDCKMELWTEKPLFSPRLKCVHTRAHADRHANTHPEERTLTDTHTCKQIKIRRKQMHTQRRKRLRGQTRMPTKLGDRWASSPSILWLGTRTHSDVNSSGKGRSSSGVVSYLARDPRCGGLYMSVQCVHRDLISVSLAPVQTSGCV